MSVYYISAPETGLLKIGFAKLPHSRLAKMQVDSPTRLILLAVEAGSKAVEAERHEQFAALRSRGEWFSYDGALKCHVEALEPYVAPQRKAVPGPLGAWLRANGYTLDAFAAKVGTTHPTLCKLCAGKHMPRRELLTRIVEATDWELDADAILGIPAKPDEQVLRSSPCSSAEATTAGTQLVASPFPMET